MITLFQKLTYSKIVLKDPCGVCFLFLTYVCLFYAYFIIFSFHILNLMNESLWGYLNATVFTVLTFLCVISHMRASFSNPGYASLLDPEEIRENGEKIELTMCQRCEIYRSANTHHCKICQRCIRNRHHHCQWINNCVGERNQKYFIQFAFYTVVSCIYSIVFVMSSLIMYPDEAILQNNHENLTPSTRVYHSVFVIVECVIFGLFVFAIICEQITSITSACSKLDDLTQEEEMTKTFNVVENFKNVTYLNYDQFRRVFKSDNPIFWLLPIDVEPLLYFRKKNSKPNQQYDA